MAQPPPQVLELVQRFDRSRLFWFAISNISIPFGIRPCGPTRQKSGAPQDLAGKPPMAGEWDASTRLYREMQ
jgi:hypothetical protein